MLTAKNCWAKKCSSVLRCRQPLVARASSLLTLRNTLSELRRTLWKRGETRKHRASRKMESLCTTRSCEQMQPWLLRATSSQPCTQRCTHKEIIPARRKENEQKQQVRCAARHRKQRAGLPCKDFRRMHGRCAETTSC